MLADTKRELSTALGILHKHRRRRLRATFIVDPQGIIRWASVNDLSVGRNVGEVLRTLDACRPTSSAPATGRKGPSSARNARLAQVLLDQARELVAPATVDDARAAATLMAMNNVYYRSKHMLVREEYQALPARLRMTRIARPAGASWTSS
jgi:hypothetical protein